MISFSEFKKYFIFTFIGSLIIAAIVAVVTVLTGQINEVTWRVFSTLFMVVIHSLVSLLFIWDDSKRNTFNRLSFFINTIFVIIILSFVASLFGIWKIVEGETVWHFYQTFFLIGFASLHADILSKAMGKEKYMDYVIYANYAFIIALTLLLLPTIYIRNAETVLGEMYYRFLAAVGIVDGTLSILTIIFYKLHAHKHPELKSGANGEGNKRRFGVGTWVIIIISVLIFFRFFLPLLFMGSMLWR